MLTGAHVLLRTGVSPGAATPVLSPNASCN